MRSLTAKPNYLSCLLLALILSRSETNAQWFTGVQGGLARNTLLTNIQNFTNQHLIPANGAFASIPAFYRWRCGLTTGGALTFAQKGYAITATFQPWFAALSFNDPVAQDSAHSYFTQMARNLIDNHYSLSFHNPAWTTISPADMRKTDILPSIWIQFFQDSIIRSPYLDWYIKGDTSYIASVGDQRDTIDVSVVAGLIQQHIVYFHHNQFYLKDAIDSLHPYWLSEAWDWFLDVLRNPNIATQGLIVDLRSNNGGELDDMNFITGQIIPQTMQFGYTRSKNGNGRLDYTPWASATVTMSDNSAKYQGPIVVLTDQHTVSMAEQTTMALRLLPNTVVIGDLTWGATGPLTTNYADYDGGQFDFANFGYVYTSSSMFKYMNGEVYEGKGFPPDILVHANFDSLHAGRDVQLQTAIDYLNSK